MSQAPNLLNADDLPEVEEVVDEDVMKNYCPDEISSSKQEQTLIIMTGLSMTAFGLIPPNRRAIINRIKSRINNNTNTILSSFKK